MYREMNFLYRRINLIVDGLLTGLAFKAAMYISGYIYIGRFCIPKNMHGYDWLLYPVVILWPVLLIVNGLYPTNRLRTFTETAKLIAHAGFQGALFIFAVLFLFKLEVVSRIFVFDLAALATIFLIVKEGIVRWYVSNIRKSGANTRNVLVVGSGDSVRYIVKKIEDHKSLGLKMIGILVPLEEAHEKEFWGHGVLGSFDDIETVLHNFTVDNVIITTYMMANFDAMENVISRCEEEGVEVWLPARIFHTKFAKPEGDEFMDIPMFVFRTEPKLSWQLLTKLVLDRICGLILTVLSFPVILLAAAAIKITSPGPAIFRQVRCGFHGRKFTMYKLRTMRVGAEATKEELAGLNIVKGPAFKLEKDPRITPLGRFLRKTSIDELPQFWNVLKGEMSLVGPRPPLPEEVVHYKGWQRRRLSMKPGITGLLQVSGRSSVIDFDSWADHDLDYIEGWSLWLDTKILLKTIFVVLSTKGAK